MSFNQVSMERAIAKVGVLRDLDIDAWTWKTFGMLVSAEAARLMPHISIKTDEEKYFIYSFYAGAFLTRHGTNVMTNIETIHTFMEEFSVFTKRWGVEWYTQLGAMVGSMVFDIIQDLETNQTTICMVMGSYMAFEMMAA